MTEKFSLLRGCALFDNRRAPIKPSYLFGNIGRVATVTSVFERTALTQLAAGIDPLSCIDASMRTALEKFLAALAQAGLLNQAAQELILPTRNLTVVGERDAAINQLRTRCAPELLQAEWSDGASDGGSSTLAARAQFPIELSGRSRVITLLYAILLQSGVSRVRFADRHLQPQIGASDIGIGAITEGEVGLAFYEKQESLRRGLSLFPIDRGARHDSDYSTPLAVIHYGDCDPEQLVEWSNRRIPHLLIHSPIGDEVVVGPLVINGESPCIRCFSLYEIDNFGFTRLERIDLTTIEELPAVTAHYIAAIAAAQILHFIDQQSSKVDSPLPRNTGIGEVAYINFQKLTEPQVVAIARHPLCGCDYELQSR